jgi:DNA-binding XRE family transcriptional regulator
MHIEYLIRDVRMSKHMSIEVLAKKADVSMRTYKRDRKRYEGAFIFRND